MSFLLDTNVISEWVKPAPNPHVIRWLNEVEEDEVFLSVASLAEIRHGIELMDPGKRRDRLADWLAGELPARFAGRILGIDSRIAEAWGVVMARGQKLGLTVGSLDAFFAATAEVHRLTLVTRNVQHFERLGTPLLNPWLFVRLNRSKPLTGAELRNAMLGVVPSLIREIAAHEFFKSRISFNVSRGQDLNAAAKLLLIENQERFVGTTKPNLDRLVEEGSLNESKITSAAQRVVENLNDMAEIFIPSDPLLKSQGPLTIYYSLVRNISSARKGVLREFLLKFEQDRRMNREKSKTPNAKGINEELLNYDIQNRSTDNQGTLENRYKILISRLANFK